MLKKREGGKNIGHEHQLNDVEPAAGRYKNTTKTEGFSFVPVIDGH